jgi:hypothetical protein
MKLALIFILFLVSPLAVSAVYRKVRVALQRGLCANGLELDNLVNAINADGRFRASIVDDSQIDSEEELNDFDTVYLGGAGSDTDANQLSTAAATAISLWVQKGGGLVTSGFLPSRGLTSPSLTSALQAVTPVTFDTRDSFCRAADNYAVDFTDFTHPVAANVPSSYFFVNAYCVFSAAGIPNGARSIAVVRDTTCPALNSVTAPQAVVVMEPGSGRAVYMCGAFCSLDVIYQSKNLMINDYTKQTFFSALWWTANIGECPPDCDGAMAVLPPLLAVILALLLALAF